MPQLGPEVVMVTPSQEAVVVLPTTTGNGADRQVVPRYVTNFNSKVPPTALKEAWELLFESRKVKVVEAALYKYHTPDEEVEQLIVPLTVEGDVDCFLQLSKNIPARTKNKHNAFLTTSLQTIKPGVHRRARLLHDWTRKHIIAFPCFTTDRHSSPFGCGPRWRVCGRAFQNVVKPAPRKRAA
jgi:hypothetical protein